MSEIKNLYSIETGNFKLDGGAMFGVVPKVIWEKTNPADDLNMIDMAARSLLIETASRLILIDTGLAIYFNLLLLTFAMFLAVPLNIFPWGHCMTPLYLISKFCIFFSED